MDLYSAFATGFLGAFCAILLISIVIRAFKRAVPQVSRWLTRHIVMSRVFDRRHTINPTRAQIICVIAHWGITAFYNIFRVQTISQASTRAGQLGLLHVIPLLSPMQIVFSSHALDISLINAEYTHITLGSMAVIQGCLHCILNYAQETRPQKISAFEIMAIASLATLLISPLARRRVYELFLYVHQIATITLVVALWMHIDAKGSESRAFLVAGLGLYLFTWLFQLGRALYINIGVRKNTKRSNNLSKSGDLDDTHIGSFSSRLRINYLDKIAFDENFWVIRIRLARNTSIQPGAYVFLTLWTFSNASILQRHPYVVIWREDLTLGESNIYLLIKSQKGWSKTYFRSLLKRQKREIEVKGTGENTRGGHIEMGNMKVWLSGPYGRSYESGSCDLSNYDHVLLLAQDLGISSLLPLMKNLVDRWNSSVIRTRRVKLVWDTKGIYLNQVMKWVNDLLAQEIISEYERVPSNDRSGSAPRHVPFLEICMHVPKIQLPNDSKSEEYKKSRLSWSDQPIAVENYIQEEAGGRPKKVAVVVSAFPQMRHETRAQVFRHDSVEFRIFEHDFQPQPDPHDR